jgi:hypothetical protein
MTGPPREMTSGNLGRANVCGVPWGVTPGAVGALAAGAGPIVGSGAPEHAATSTATETIAARASGITHGLEHRACQIFPTETFAIHRRFRVDAVRGRARSMSRGRDMMDQRGRGQVEVEVEVEVEVAAEAGGRASDPPKAVAEVEVEG